jgi:hypothetical protein
MNSRTIANFVYDPAMQAQPLAVLAFLSTEEPEFAEWDDERKEYKYEQETHAWWNGRERGFSLMASLPMRDPVTLICVECRRSDQIRVYRYEGQSRMNPPVVADMPASAWDNYKYFDYGDILGAYNYIKAGIAQYLLSDSLKRTHEAIKNLRV